MMMMMMLSRRMGRRMGTVTGTGQGTNEEVLLDPVVAHGEVLPSQRGA